MKTKTYKVYGTHSEINGRSYTRHDSAMRGIQRDRRRQRQKYGMVLTEAWWIVVDNHCDGTDSCSV